MGLLDWFKKKTQQDCSPNVAVAILAVQPVMEPEGEVHATVTVSAQARAVVGLKSRLISVVLDEDGAEVEAEQASHGEMNELFEAVFEKAGEQRIDIAFPYDLRGWGEKQGGLIAAAGKLAEAAKQAVTKTTEQPQKFFIEVQCNVNGEWDTPTDRKAVQVALPE